MKSRLFFRLFGTYLCIILLSFTVVYIFMSGQIRTTAIQRSEETLATYTQIMDLQSKGEIIDNMDRLARISGVRVTVIDRSGRVQADSAMGPLELENHLNRPEIQEARVKGRGMNIRYSKTLDMEMLYVAFPIQAGGVIDGYLRLSMPLVDAKRSMDRLERSILVASVVVILLSLLLTYIFSFHLVAPIREMEQFTERLRRGETPGTLLIRRTDEMQQLAGNINYLFEELQLKIYAAEEEKEKLIAAFASMREGVLVLDRDDRVEVYNRAFHHMVDPEFGDVTGKTLMEAFRNVDLHDAFGRFRVEGQTVVQEVILGKAVPQVLEVSISAVRVPGEGKTMMVFHDLTRLKKLEKMRVDFVANVTHEIRTPLTSIIGFIETLQRGGMEDRETALRFLGIIAEQAQRLNRLLDDLLILSNIELGEAPFHLEAVQLGPVVNDVLATLEGRMQLKGLAFSQNIPDALPPLLADRDRLIQVLLNTLDNAIKFTPEGGRVTLSAEGAGDNQVVIRIADTGVGIPQNEIPRLGERFYRVDKTRSREMGGTGLGLSIVKHIMAVHQGRLEIESRLAQGTTVSLYFPVAREV